MTKQVVDISYCQSKIDYKALKLSGIDAVIIRNGYYSKTDDTWEQHVNGCISAGLNIGTYTYMLSSNPTEAISEAKYTIKRLEKYKGKINYPVFADMEADKYLKNPYSTTLRTAILNAFLETINAAGYYPAVYTNPAWLENYIQKNSILGKYDIWLAAWTDSPTKTTKYQYGQTMWQWGLGNVNGINGKVDCDLVYIDYPKKIIDLDKNFLVTKKKVILAFNAAVRSEPKTTSKLLATLKAGTKCYALKGTETIDPVSKFEYIQILGNKTMWIVKSAIQGGNV